MGKVIDLNFGDNKILIETDNDTIIKQLKEEWEVKTDILKEPFNSVKAKLNKFSIISVEKIQREENRAVKIGINELGLEEDPLPSVLRNIEAYYKSSGKKYRSKRHAIECEKCGSEATFKLQIFKNETEHIQKKCKKCGFTCHVPKEEPFISITTPETTKQNTLF